MMVVPLPPMLLDLIITLNISAALAIVIATMYLPRALDFSSFPTLLLLTTLFRLAINVCVTRLILLHGDAGNVVQAFGNFVVGGNVVVGLVIFLILVVIQFVVITNGAGRVAEVGARFTLDAMPGKQMAIDADLNAGQITDEEARERRARRSPARPTSTARWTAPRSSSRATRSPACSSRSINLLGGIVVGVVQQGMPFGEAIHHFSLLTVGDGLCAQIPALLISVATGIIVTRSASEKDLGTDIAGQILGQRKAPLVAGAVICAFALVPGLPKLPFLLIGGMFFFVGRRWRKVPPTRPARPREAAAAARPPAGGCRAARRRARGARDRPARARDRLRPGPARRPARAAARCCSASARPPPDRSELGIVIPPVRIHDDVGLDSHEYVMQGARHRGRARPRHARPPARDGPGRRGRPAPRRPDDRAGLRPARRRGSPTAAAPRPRRSATPSSTRESVIVTHLTETIRRHVAELLTRQETRQLLDRLKEHNAAVVEEVVPDLLTVGEIQRVLQALLREGVSIRDLGAIVEAIGDKARLTRDPALLAEYARQALGRTIVAPHIDARAARSGRSRSTPPSSRRSPSDRHHRRGRVPGDGARRAPRRSCSRCADAVRRRIARGRRPVLLCSAACAATCAGCASRPCPSSRCVPTTRSRPASASRRSES